MNSGPARDLVKMSASWVLLFNPSDFYVASCDVRAKMIIFNSDVPSARAHFWSLDKLHTSFVVFEDGGAGDGLAEL